MKRAIILVIDSMGAGAMADCAQYNDVPECNTLDRKSTRLNSSHTRPSRMPSSA